MNWSGGPNLALNPCQISMRGNVRPSVESLLRGTSKGWCFFVSLKSIPKGCPQKNNHAHMCLGQRTLLLGPGMHGQPERKGFTTEPHRPIIVAFGIKSISLSRTFSPHASILKGGFLHHLLTRGRSTRSTLGLPKPSKFHLQHGILLPKLLVGELSH